MYSLNTPLTTVKGIGPKLSEELAKHNLYKVKDVILLLPLRYEDRSKLVTIADIPEDELITFQATITSASQFYKNKKSIQSARAKDTTGIIKLMWFNNKFIMSKIRNGGEFLISGKKGKNNTIIQPVVEDVKAETLHTNRLVPLYSSTIAIKQGSIRHILKEIVDNLLVAEDELDILIGTRNKGLASRVEAKSTSNSATPSVTKDQEPRTLIHLPLTTVIKELHFPSELENIERARYRLVLEEFLSLMKVSEQLKSYWNNRADAKMITVQQAYKVIGEQGNRGKVGKGLATTPSESSPRTKDQELPAWLPKTIPFELTNAQKRVTQEILDDLAKNVPMNRIVIGDVGSGKTVVAGIACQQVLLNGHNAAFIAPTKILAEQHCTTIRKLFPNLHVELVTSATNVSLKKREPVKQGERFSNPITKTPRGKTKSNPSHSGVKSNATIESSTDPITPLRSIQDDNKQQPTLYIGTHAILNRLLEIKPALIVYDEQHRFGVIHRSQAQQLGYSPHIVTMTATPIPRTMMLTLFSHLKLSAIDELPAGRIPPKTWVISERKRLSSYEWIKQQLKDNKDQQVIVVCPFIDPSEAEALENVAAATQTFESVKSIFVDETVELLHGRMKKAEQGEVIADLFAKKIKILVTTPIVEVGVDLPQASIIIIEAAERFGLSSLHQLRGRVGRAGQESFCLLFTNSHSKTVKERLKAFSEETNGLKLAELDLQNRGAGDIFGVQQSGFTGLQYGSWTNMEMIALAQRIFPDLTPDWQPTLVSMPKFEDIVPYAN